MTDNTHMTPFAPHRPIPHAVPSCALEARPLGAEKRDPSDSTTRHGHTVGAATAFDRTHVMPHGAPRAYGVSWGEGEGG
jgi:hypothetical protein